MTPRLDELEFEKVPHRYVVRGRELGSVTHLLREHGLGFQGVAPQEALNRGQFVHECSVLLDEHDLDRGSVPEKWAGYLDAYELAVRELELRMVAAEWRSWHPDYLYAGTLDRVAIRKGKRLLFDLKTGDTSDVDAQVAGYERLWRYWRPKEPVAYGACLKVNEDGTYRWFDFDIEAGWRIFAACLVVEERKRANGSKRSERIAA